MTYLCSEKCNKCEAVENLQLAVILNVLALKFGKEVWHIVNSICPNMTCCPICHIDDFCHYDKNDGAFCTPISRVEEEDETCTVAKSANRIFKKLKEKEKK